MIRLNLRKLFITKAILCFIFQLSFCKKTDSVDITEYDWKLIKVESEGEVNKLPNKDFNSQPNPYLLQFEDDTNMFFLPTNVNTAGGDYDIPQKGKINIHYGRFSQAGEGEMTSFNDTLIKVFNEVNSYEVKRGFRMTLTFEGPQGEVKFKKK